MTVVMLCDAFGWTYDQYRNQPGWFIDLLKKKRYIDGLEPAELKKLNPDSL